MIVKITCPGENGDCRHRAKCNIKDWWMSASKRLIRELKHKTEGCLSGKLPEITLIASDCKLVIYPEKAKQEKLF